MIQELYDELNEYLDSQIEKLENIRIENSALVFGDTDQRQMRLGITLEKLNSKYQSISQYLFDLKKWFSEGAMKPEGFFFNNENLERRILYG